MRTVRLHVMAVALLIPILVLVSGQVPEAWVEGPFNYERETGPFSENGLVPETLFHNNRSRYVTVWDAAGGSYATYDQNSGERQLRVIFVDPQPGFPRGEGGWAAAGTARGGGRVRILGGKAVPTTHLDEEGMRIQAQYGCRGCHAR